MEDDNSKGVNKGNVVKGPWKRIKLVSKSQTQKITEDMNYIDELCESIVIPVIHSLAENGVNIKSDEFVRDIGFINESVKATVCRSLEYPHPMQSMIDMLMITSSATTEEIFASFDHEILDEMLTELSTDDDDDNDDDDGGKTA